MDLISILATVILITTIGTMVVGVGAYAAFKLRDKRKPAKKKADDTLDSDGTREPIFLKRYIPEPEAKATGDEP
ncbi:MAG: hypothetical protein KJ614_16965 [Gammaproteobacteria bacterium]|uniref:hypothetical protein n=1 Tax=Rhodoferax sp. TaxID=50421 RepID=UPI0017AC91F5|nr:hypothetical protein [Rhodoferax sp.]MBU3900587.1 hypothetical protein [Gammaproteobacteria bacterium]MBA3057508.1 hypothetical protein [Rhodoferax sp.]MBU3997343.1 hypothetical protein [Gammaproteobacteria bacterium]MBU4080032.1 hypothetical protein [Gammaproteobacteria bacterium]MBU4113488.1 hypothetical protein [Gammaproteobacteria bacterium]